MGAKTKNYSYLAPDFALKAVAKRYNGEVTEWFKERAWKVRTPQKGVEGSNPSLSAQGKKHIATSALMQRFFMQEGAMSSLIQPLICIKNHTIYVSQFVS